MLKSFLKKLSRQSTETIPEDDCRLALSILMVRVARSDRDYSENEKNFIEKIIVSRYGITTLEAQELRQRAEIIESEASDSVQFTRILKDKIAFSERKVLLESLWRIVLADGRRDYEEDGFMRLITRLLGVSDKDSALVRQHVSNKINSNQS